VSRRTAVGGVAVLTAVVVSGCTPRGIDRRPRARASAPTSPRTDPDVALAAAVLTDEQDMLDRVLATLRRHPRLEPLLAGARAAHQAHVELLTDAVPERARRSSVPSPSSGTSPSVSPSVAPSAGASPRVPARAPAALAVLAGQEDRLALLGRRSAFTAESGAFARVLASMAAAASQQSVTLAAAAQDRR
jgi:hypothetical protein